MNKGLFIRVFVCIFFLGGCLYSYLNMQNEITQLRIRIPELIQSVRRIEEENTRLHFEIEAFESPVNLMALAQSSEFAYMKYPSNQDVLTMAEPQLLGEEQKAKQAKRSRQSSITFASGNR